MQKITLLVCHIKYDKYVSGRKEITLINMQYSENYLISINGLDTFLKIFQKHKINTYKTQNIWIFSTPDAVIPIDICDKLIELCYNISIKFIQYSSDAEFMFRLGSILNNDENSEFYEYSLLIPSYILNEYNIKTVKVNASTEASNEKSEMNRENNSHADTYVNLIEQKIKNAKRKED